MTNPPGESGNRPLRLDFDRCGKLELHGAGIIAASAALAWREFDDVRRSKGN